MNKPGVASYWTKLSGFWQKSSPQGPRKLLLDLHDSPDVKEVDPYVTHVDYHTGLSICLSVLLDINGKEEQLRFILAILKPDDARKLRDALTKELKRR